MLRRSIVVVLAVALGVLGACTGDEGDQDEVGIEIDGDDLAVGEPSSLELPSPRPVNPFVVPVDGGVWVIGGVTGRSSAWVPSNWAVLYDASGAPVRSVSLPVDDGRFLASGTIVGDDDAILVATACVVPTSRSGCDGRRVPVVVRLGGEAEPVGLDGPLADLGDGRSLMAVGPGPDDGAVVAAAAGRGAGSSDPVVVEAWALGVDGTNEELALPEGVFGVDAVCGGDDGVFAATPSTSGGVAVVDVDSGEEIASLTVPLVGTDDVVLSCVEGAVVLYGRGSPGVLAVLDPEAGEWVDDPVDVDGAGSILVAAADGSAVVLTARDVGDDATGGRQTILTYRASAEGVTVLEPFETDSGTDHLGVDLGGGVVDAGALVTDPEGGSLPPLGLG